MHFGTYVLQAPMHLRASPQAVAQETTSIVLHTACENSATGTRTRVARVRAEYPNQLDYSGSDWLAPNVICVSMHPI